MKVTKIGHCCLSIEISGKRILTDPGSFTVDGHVLEGIDIILITHEHGDHLHTDSLKEIVQKNPDATIVTNSGVGKLLDEAGIAYTLLEGTAEMECAGVHVAAYDAPHAEIFEEFGQVQNTGYFIAERLFYPGDAYAEPGKPVEVLALPVAGPWCKVADAIRYALAVQPQKVFPVHDGLLNDTGTAIHHRVVEANLTEHGVSFISLKAGENAEF